MSRIATTIVLITILIAAFAGIYLLTSNIFLGPVVIPADFSADRVVRLLLAVIVTILLLERFLEISKTIMRGRETTLLRRAVETASEEIQEVGKNSAELQKKRSLLRNTQTAYELYRTGTRQWVCAIGFLFGTLMSLIGVRVLQVFIDLSYAPPGQINSFTVMDIMLTGAFLTGGSITVHHFYGFLSGLIQKSRSQIPGEK